MLRVIPHTSQSTKQGFICFQQQYPLLIAHFGINSISLSWEFLLNLTYWKLIRVCEKPNFRVLADYPESFAMKLSIAHAHPHSTTLARHLVTKTQDSHKNIL